MPFNLQQYRGVVRAFNSRFNYNDIHNSAFNKNPNVSLVASICFAILVNFCSSLPVVCFLSVLCLVMFDFDKTKWRYRTEPWT